MDEIEITRRAFEVPDQDPESKDRARARLHEAVAAAERSAVVDAAPRRPFVRPARWLGIAAAILAAVLVAQTVLTRPEGGPSAASVARAHAHAEAAAQLHTIGAMASSTRPGPIPAGMFVYLFSRETTISQKDSSDLGNQDVATGRSYDLSIARTVQTWVAPDGSGLRITTTEGVSFATEQDHLTWLAMKSPALPGVGGVRSQSFGQGELTAGIDLRTLPTDPALLASALRPIPGTDPRTYGDRVLMDHIADLLCNADPAPALRAALFAVLADMPGVRSLGQVHDPLDRPGVGFVMPLGSRDREIIVDPSTSNVLASVTSDPGPGGEVRSSTVYTGGAIVSRPHMTT